MNVDVFTIGFTKRSAADFFETLRRAGVKCLLDVRLNNSSQLAGFTKAGDLPFFLKEICGAAYQHEPLLAPTLEMLDAFKKAKGSWEEYERRFLQLMAERKIEEKIDRNMFTTPTALLCSETIAEHCHRRLVLEYLQEKWGGLTVIHL
jgi:uncharacterized protein (DUF488 family)